MGRRHGKAPVRETYSTSSPSSAGTGGAAGPCCAVAGIIFGKAMPALAHPASSVADAVMLPGNKAPLSKAFWTVAVANGLLSAI